jgi:uncharacterized DUF497 family protein
MPPLQFQSDPHKASSNLRKHGVSFEEAMTIFNDPLSATFVDELHSEDESRFITVGLSSKRRLLFISHLEDDGKIRIIGARPASAAERQDHEENTR